MLSMGFAVVLSNGCSFALIQKNQKIKAAKKWAKNDTERLKFAKLAKKVTTLIKQYARLKHRRISLRVA